MQYSAGLTDKIILFFCSLSLYLFQPGRDVFVVPVIIAVVFSSFISYFEQNAVKAGLILGFVILCIFFNELVFFLPLIAFDMAFYKYQVLSLLAVIPVLNLDSGFSLQTVSIIIMAAFLALWLKFRVVSKNRLQARFSELNDAAREMSIRLKKQNKDLIEKQDTELNLATLNERNRIAREIHDNVGHLLSSAILQSGALLTVSQDERIKTHLQTLNDTLSKAMNSIRTSVHDLYDESVDLNAQAFEIIRQFTFCEISYDYQFSTNPPQKLKYTFISILKEALSNIIKHSDATRVDVAFREHPAFYQMVIRDNGNPKEYQTQDGMGLKNMAERVNSLDGIINIQCDNGFEIFISIPKEALIK